MKKTAVLMHLTLMTLILTYPVCVVYGDTSLSRGKVNLNTRYPLLFRCNGAFESDCKTEITKFASQLGCVASSVDVLAENQELKLFKNNEKPTPELFLNLQSTNCFRATFTDDGCPKDGKVERASSPEKKVSLKKSGPIEFKEFFITLIDEVFCKTPVPRKINGRNHSLKLNTLEK